MRLPNSAHESRPWRIREIAPDFILEDVWALPTPGGADDFPALLELMARSNPAGSSSLPTRVLWHTRERLGKLFDLGGISAPPVATRTAQRASCRIKPFRHLIVYPALTRQTERAWSRRH